MQIYDNKSKCYGCGKCMIVCPVDAVKMVKDEEGFLYPNVDVHMCINCGKCKDACIINLEDAKNLHLEFAYAGWVKNKDILKNSTSGGVFLTLAKEILQSGGVVYGAAYVDGLKVEHVRVETEANLQKLQGSKYVQSNMSGILLNVQKDINDGRKVLFSGTPCQIAAIRSLYGEIEGLICVEIACMGCPSPVVWEKYVECCQKKWGNILDVKFRDKCSGWNSSSISYICEKEKKSFRHHMDIYMEGFSQALYYRPSCHKCIFKGKNSFGDIKIGDFWGIQNYDESYKEIDGVSAILIETTRGEKIFDAIRNKMDIKTFPYKFAIAYNEYFELSRQPSKNRSKFFEGIKNKEGKIDDWIYECLYPKINEKELYWYRYPVVENLLQLVLKESGVSDFFKRNGYSKVAIYGLGDLGMLLVKLLKKEGVNISCLIDRNYKRFPEYMEDIKVIGLHQVLDEEYDCIIVTALLSYNNILELLMVQGVELNKIISIGSIV